MSKDLKKKINQASYLLMGSVLISRVIGFFREWVLAQTIGANRLTDVYYASFTIPDFINYLMAAGALSISFIPLLNRHLVAGKEQEARNLFRYISSWMGLALALVLAGAYFLAPYLATWVAPGFTGEDRILLIQLLQIILPAQFFFYWGGLAIAVQHCFGQFLIPAVAPIVYNLGIILVGIGMHSQWGIKGFSVGVVVGCFFSHGLLQWIGLRRLHFSVLPKFRGNTALQDSFRRYFWLSLPISLGFSIVVSDEWIAKYYASLLEPKAVSWLSYARTQMRIPVAILGQAAGIASFPFLSRLWAEKKYGEFSASVQSELSKVWLLAPLATIVMLTHGEQITYFIYGGGKFTSNDLNATAKAMQWMAWGVLFWVMQIPLARAFYAAEHTWLPSLIGTLLSFVSIPLYGELARRWGHLGLAAAGSLSIAVYCCILAIILAVVAKRRGLIKKGRQWAAFLVTWSLCCVVFYGISDFFARHALFAGTRVTALVDVVLVCGVLGVIAFVLQRKFLARLTGGPLF